MLHVGHRAVGVDHSTDSLYGESRAEGFRIVTRNRIRSGTLFLSERQGILAHILYLWLKQSNSVFMPAECMENIIQWQPKYGVSLLKISTLYLEKVLQTQIRGLKAALHLTLRTYFCIQLQPIVQQHLENTNLESHLMQLQQTYFLARSTLQVYNKLTY